MTEWSNESAANFVWSLNIPLRNYLDDSEGHSYGQLLIGSFTTTTYPSIHTSRLVQSSLVKHQITQVVQPPYNPDLVPCDFWLFPKLKPPLKKKRFHTIDEIQENTTGQLIAMRTGWDPEVPALKGTEASLSCVQCFLCLVSSSMNVSIFHSTWLDTFWTNLIYSCEEKKQLY